MHGTRLPGGETSSAFAQHVARLLECGVLEGPASSSPLAAAAQSTNVLRLNPGHSQDHGRDAGRCGRRHRARRFPLRAVRAHRKMCPAAWTLPPPRRDRSEQRRASTFGGIAFGRGAALCRSQSRQTSGVSSDGIAEQIMSALAESVGCALPRVLRHSHSKAKESPSPRDGAGLRVSHIIEGSVRRAGERLRVTVHLSTCRTDPRRGAILTIGSCTISLRFRKHQPQHHRASSRATHGPRSRTQSLVRKARIKRPTTRISGGHAWAARSPAGLQRSVEYFERAVEKDPNSRAHTWVWPMR